MIKTLSLQDFGPYKNKEFKFIPGINIITGTNHTGKSTIKQGIRYTLAGTPAKKEVSELKRMAPNSKCQTTMVVDFAGQIHTIFRQPEPNTLKLNGTKLKLGKEADKDGLYDYGYKRNVLKMLCDASNFFELKPEEQREILVNYFSGDEEIDVTKYGMSAEDAKDFAGLRLSNIKSTAERFRETRATVNKMIEQSKAEIRINNENTQKTNAVYTMDELLAQKKAIEEEIAKCKKIEMPLSTPEIEALRDEKHKIKMALPVELDKYTAKTKEISIKGNANKAIIEAYKKNAGKCPISGGTVDCHEPGLAAFVASLEKANDELRAEYNRLAEECEVERQKFEEDKENKLSNLHYKIVAAEAAYNEKLAEVDGLNSAAQKCYNELAVKLDGVKISIHQQEAQAKLKDKNIELASSLIELEKNSERFTRFIVFLEKELKEKILSGSSSDFFEKINRLSRKFGFDIEAQNGDLAKLLINGKTLGMLSTSERIICGISLQLTIAELSGYNFFVADDLESLDPEYMEILIEFLDGCKKITAILIGLRLFEYLVDGDYEYVFPGGSNSIVLTPEETEIPEKQEAA